MTLVLSAVTPCWAIQASDCRMTCLDNSAFISDEMNKVVIFGKRMIFGITGLARLEGLPAHAWLVEKLNGMLNKPLPKILARSAS